MCLILFIMVSSSRARTLSAQGETRIKYIKPPSSEILPSSTKTAGVQCNTIGEKMREKKKKHSLFLKRSIQAVIASQLCLILGRVLLPFPAEMELSNIVVT